MIKKGFLLGLVLGMKYNKEIERQYQVEKLKREIRALVSQSKELYSHMMKLELKIKVLKTKLRWYWEKFYC